MTTTIYLYCMNGEESRQSPEPPTDIDIACIYEGDLDCLRVECSGVHMQIDRLAVSEDTDEASYACKWVPVLDSPIKQQEEDKLPYHSFS